MATGANAAAAKRVQSVTASLPRGTTNSTNRTNRGFVSFVKFVVPWASAVHDVEMRRRARVVVGAPVAGPVGLAVDEVDEAVLLEQREVGVAGVGVRARVAVQ